MWVFLSGERKVLPYILTAFGSCYRNEVSYVPKGPNSHVPCSWRRGAGGQGFLPEQRAGRLITPATGAPWPEAGWWSRKSTGLRVRRSDLWSCLHHPLAVRPQASLLASPSLSFFICKMEMIISSLPTSQGCCKDQITYITQLCIHWVEWYANVRDYGLVTNSWRNLCKVTFLSLISRDGGHNRSSSF